MIGCAVTTTDQEKLDKFLSNWALVCPELDIFVYNDEKKKGVRHSKNECLRFLKDHDYIFLFDDDCFPKKGWSQFMLPHLDKWNHLCFNTPEIHKTKFILDDLLVTENCGGVFMAYKKEVIQKAGYMDERYTGYGWEHLGYSQRIFRMGLTINPYLSIVGMDKYFEAEDYKNPNVRPRTEQSEKNRLIFIEESSYVY